jgi:hypothetical protein
MIAHRVKRLPISELLCADQVNASLLASTIRRQSMRDAEKATHCSPSIANHTSFTQICEQKSVSTLQNFLLRQKSPFTAGFVSTGQAYFIKLIKIDESAAYALA